MTNYNSNNDSKIDQYTFKGTGLTTSEKRLAKKNFENYKARYHIDNISDLSLLEELCFREALQERTKKQVARINKSKTVKEEDLIPTKHLTALNENLERIVILKDKLCLFEDKKTEDPLKYIQILKKKFQKWLEQNQGSRSLICPYCSERIMLRIKSDCWDAQKHSFFHDNILCNDHLVKLFLEGKITKSDCAKILGTSEDYIIWLIDKWYHNEEVRKESDK